MTGRTDSGIIIIVKRKMKEGIQMKKIFLDLDGTLAQFNVEGALERFDKEIGFFANLLAFDKIEIVNELAKNNNLFIVSASPNIQADLDKMEWIKKYLPDMPIQNITLCRLGENKAEIIQKKYSVAFDASCFLLDDYTKNLWEWEKMGGTGIKRLTVDADNSTNKWKGLTLSSLEELINIY